MTGLSWAGLLVTLALLAWWGLAWPRRARHGWKFQGVQLRQQGPSRQFTRWGRVLLAGGFAFWSYAAWLFFLIPVDVPPGPALRPTVWILVDLSPKKTQATSLAREFQRRAPGLLRWISTQEQADVGLLMRHPQFTLVCPPTQDHQYLRQTLLTLDSNEFLKPWAGNASSQITLEEITNASPAVDGLIWLSDPSMPIPQKTLEKNLGCPVLMVPMGYQNLSPKTIKQYQQIVTSRTGQVVSEIKRAEQVQAMLKPAEIPTPAPIVQASTRSRAQTWLLVGVACVSLALLTRHRPQDE